MSNKRWTRVLALCLAVVCTLTAVSAAVLYDQNGDEKLTVWDLQAMFKSGDKDYDAAVEAVLGGKDELNPVSEGVFEIYTELGLRNMAKYADKGYTFKLMNNIDLGGKDWRPIANFVGIFEGNNKTVSNFKITQASGDNMGFFAQTNNKVNGTPTTEIRNLHLEDVELIVAKEATDTCTAQFIGPIVGTSRGNIVNCTAVCAVTDARTVLTKETYYGALVGRNATRKLDDNSSVSVGKINCSNSMDADLNITAASNQEFTKPDLKVSAKMATFFGTLEEGSQKRKTGIAGVGQADGYTDTALLWQDITNSTKLVSENIQKRREEVARYMYEMCTVEWSPSKTLKVLFYRSGQDRSKDDFYPNQVYRGIPYNHGASSLDRFNYWINNDALPADGYYLTDNKVIETFNNTLTDSTLYTVDSQGRKVIKTIYGENGRYWTNPAHNHLPSDWDTALAVGGTYLTGLACYIGNDCSTAAALAWRRVSASYGTGMVAPTATTNMYPSPQYITEGGNDFTGILPVNGLTFENTTTSSADMAAAVKSFATANAEYFYDTLALTSKGDLLMGYKDAGGHTLVAISDAVVIRNRSGKLDTQKSYIVTAEQGGGGLDSDGKNHYEGKNAKNVAWTSDCAVDRRTTFADLAPIDSTKVTGKGNSGYYFFPITCTALREEDTPAATVGLTYGGGKNVTSNFHIEATTRNGEITYTRTTKSGSRSRMVNLDLTTVYSGLTAGEQITVLLSDGQSHTITYGTSYKTSYSVDDILPAVN